MTNPKRTKVDIYESNVANLTDLMATLGLDSMTATVNWLARNYAVRATSDYGRFTADINPTSAQQGYNPLQHPPIATQTVPIPSSVPPIVTNSDQGVPDSSNADIQRSELPPEGYTGDTEEMPKATVTPRKGNRLKGLG